MFFETIKHAKTLINEGRYTLTEVDKQIIETDIGEFEVYEGELVPLDLPQYEYLNEGCLEIVALEPNKDQRLKE